jgi:hypothetical protein
MSISLETKLKALREVESIYRLSKKWQRLTPDEKRPNWERIADAILKKALGTPVRARPVGLHIRRSQQHHAHSPRSARAIERTLQNGIVHPDVLHSYRNDKVEHGSTRVRYEKPRARPDTPVAQHYVQHGARDIEYPSGHMQGYGFVPRNHEGASHIQLESGGEAAPTMPTAGGAHEAPTHYQ